LTQEKSNNIINIQRMSACSSNQVK
jgi:hypothetical protein